MSETVEENTESCISLRMWKERNVSSVRKFCTSNLSVVSNVSWKYENSDFKRRSEVSLPVVHLQVSCPPWESLYFITLHGYEECKYMTSFYSMFAVLAWAAAAENRVYCCWGHSLLQGSRLTFMACRYKIWGIYSCSCPLTCLTVTQRSKTDL